MILQYSCKAQYSEIFNYTWKAYSLLPSIYSRMFIKAMPACFLCTLERYRKLKDNIQTSWPNSWKETSVWRKVWLGSLQYLPIKGLSKKPGHCMWYCRNSRNDQNEKALDKFFLVITQELSKLLHEFAAEYGSDSNDKRTQHHQITGGQLSRMMKNARKLADVFCEQGDPFMPPEYEDDIYNLLTKEVMTKKCLNTYWNETRLDTACLWNSPQNAWQTDDFV